MGNDFFKLYNNQSCLALEVGHNSIADWCITIYDINGRRLSDATEPSIMVQECTIELAFAKAYVSLCEYLSENRGGH